MSKAAKDVRASAAIIARKDRLVARKEEMMAEKRRLHAMGRVSAQEARAFIDKYRCAPFACRRKRATSTAIAAADLSLLYTFLLGRLVAGIVLVCAT